MDLYSPQTIKPLRVVLYYSLATMLCLSTIVSEGHAAKKFARALMKGKELRFKEGNLQQTFQDGIFFLKVPKSMRDDLKTVDDFVTDPKHFEYARVSRQTRGNHNWYMRLDDDTGRSFLGTDIDSLLPPTPRDFFTKVPLQNETMKGALQRFASDISSVHDNILTTILTETKRSQQFINHQFYIQRRLVFNRYGVTPPDKLAFQAHQDRTAITLLRVKQPNKASGLQVNLAKAEEPAKWIDLIVPDNHFAVLFGNQWFRHTGMLGEFPFKAIEHRVVPQHQASRISYALFGKIFPPN